MKPIPCMALSMRCPNAKPIPSASVRSAWVPSEQASCVRPFRGVSGTHRLRPDDGLESALRVFVPHRHDGADDRSPNRGEDLELAADLAQALAHGRDADARRY